MVIEGDEHLPRFHAIALANEYLVDASANFRAHARIASFHRARALQRRVVAEPAGGVNGCGERGCDYENDDEALAVHADYSPSLSPTLDNEVGRPFVTAGRGMRPDQSTLKAASMRACKLSSP